MSQSATRQTETRKLEVADIEAIFNRSRFIRGLNLQILEVDHAAARFAVRMPMHETLERGAAGSGQFHGGAIAALIDVVGDFAIGMLVGGGVPTMNLRVDYLRPATAPYVEAVAVVRKSGRSVAVVDIDVMSADGKLVAIGRGTYVPITG